MQQLEKFWKTDFVDALCSSKVTMSVDNQKALRTMEDSVKIVSGHYQVALPWRNQPPYLPNNRLAAEQRLKLLRKRFLRNEEFFQRYKGTINDYITKENALRVPHEELNLTGKPLWYLPHHAVFHPHKPDKLRVVFDCAAKFRGTSLNDQLLHSQSTKELHQCWIWICLATIFPSREHLESNGMWTQTHSLSRLYQRTKL